MTEVEVKLRLGSAEDHAKVLKLFGELQVVLGQANEFWDADSKEKSNVLTSARAVLRFRFIDGKDQAMVTLKEKSELKDGVMRSGELEEPIEAKLGRALLSDPAKMLTDTKDHALLTETIARFGITAFRPIGGYRNTRHVFQWNQHTVEVDQTHFAFGDNYEIEVESSEPERLRTELEALLQQHKVNFEYSKVNKFGIFRTGELPPFGK